MQLESSLHQRTDRAPARSSQKVLKSSEIKVDLSSTLTSFLLPIGLCAFQWSGKILIIAIFLLFLQDMRVHSDVKSVLKD